MNSDPLSESTPRIGNRRRLVMLLAVALQRLASQ